MPLLTAASSYFNFKSERTLFASPTIGMFTLTFFPISAGSTSMCITSAFFANSESLPVTLSSNLTPTAMIRSASVKARFAYFVPCMPAIPRQRLLVSGKVPLPVSDVITGIFESSANSVSTLLPFEDVTPPPAKITGLLLSSILFTAWMICLGLPLYVGLYPSRTTSDLKFSSI